MTFAPAQTAKYNLFYDWNYTGLHLQPGMYKYSVLVEDAHSKLEASHPRCCGWVNFKAFFLIVAARSTSTSVACSPASIAS